MTWIENLLFTTESVAHTVFLYAFVIALGVYLGKMKFFGISLGVTFVLFVGIVAGHFGFVGEKNIMHFLQEFGLILFVYSIGLQVGPGFFSSFKKGGMRLNMLAAGIVLLNIVVAFAIYLIANGRIEMPMLVGILSGAVTNTPGLGAAQQTLAQLHFDGKLDVVPEIASGYAAAYPLGVVGIIGSMLIIRALFKVKLDKETKEIEEENKESLLTPHLVTYKVENPLIFGRTVLDMAHIIERNFVISRIKKKNDEVIIPKSDTVIEEGDLLLTVLSVQDEDALKAFIGKPVEMDWKAIPAPVVSRRILVTKPEFNGRKIGSLRLRMGYGLNVTRLNRAGVDLVANPNLTLQVGDRLTAVGKIEDINRLAERLGNSMKRLNEPNMITLFVGILLGIVLGSIPLAIPGMSSSMKLGLAGGPLVVAILIGRFGYKFKLVTYTSTSASLMIREIGICLFLASVGLTAGGGFVDTVVNGDGLLWVLWGFLITIIPLLIIGTIGRWYYKLNYFTLMGLIAGSNTDPPALAYANKVASNDAPAVAYSTVYPLTMFLRVLTAQLMILAFA
ncbi:putative transporter [Coprobacter secundus]|uniref:Putative transporter n=1 Tax=Coprobacter secundus subsp. similis TaxID=2751153 RepID=A0A7G1HU03_9BACT|nr:putative transporter [Coprobacter secundus]BCI62011.1 putative transporter [Coprobacter secundus subsp. similis]